MTFLQKAKNKVFGGLPKRIVFAIFILGLVDIFTFLGPLYLRNVFPNPQTFFGISKAQFDQTVAIWGYVAVICYLPSGWLADKISNKKLITASVFGTGLLLAWLTTLVLNKGNAPVVGSEVLVQYYIIFGLWGITTTLTFWAPLWRLLVQQVPKKKTGTAFGLQGSFNGLIGFVVVTIIGYFLLRFNPTIGQTIGFPIFGYSIVGILFAGGIAVMLFIDEKPMDTDEETKFSFRTIKSVLKNGRVWLAALLVNAIYFMQHELAFLMPMLRNLIGTGTLLAIIIGGLRTYAMRMGIAIPAGIIGDKAKSFMLILVSGLTLMLVVMFIILLLPGFGNDFAIEHGGGRIVTDIDNQGNMQTGLIFDQAPSSYGIFVQVVVCSAIVLLGALTWILVTLRFAMISELPREKNSYGTITGLISLVAFSSNGWWNTLAASIQRSNSRNIWVSGATGETDHISSVANQSANQLIVGILIALSAIGMIAGWILYFLTRREVKKNNWKTFRRDAFEIKMPPHPINKVK